MLSVCRKLLLSSILALVSFDGFSYSEKAVDWTNKNLLVKDEIDTIKNLKFIFVTGLLNEEIINYYKIPKNVLTKDLGISNDQIITINPPSGMDIQTNADTLVKNIKNFIKPNEKFVLIGHSKGSMESLLAVLKKEFITLHNNLHAAILIQGAMNGSPVCNYMCSKGGIHADSTMGFRLIAFQVTSSIGGLMCDKYQKGFHSLFENSTEAVLETYKENLTPELNDKIFYITSQQDPAKMSSLISCIGQYLQTYYGPSDGLVLVEDQSINWVGTTIGHLTSDHAGLVVGRPISNTSKEVQKIFFTNLLRFLAHRG